MPHGTALPCNSSTDSFDYCLTKANLETLVNPENGLHVTGCRCTEKKVCEERCYAWMFNPYKVMSIIGYVCMYRSRGKSYEEIIHKALLGRGGSCVVNGVTGVL